MPSAMAPSSEPRKIDDGHDRCSLTGCGAELGARRQVALRELRLQLLELLLLLGFLDHDQLLLGDLAGERRGRGRESRIAGRDAEDDADAVEQARSTGRTAGAATSS